MFSCMRSLFISVGGRGCGGLGSLKSMRVLVAWRGGLFLAEGMHMAYSISAQGSGRDTWRAQSLESRHTKSRHILIRIGVRSTLVYIYAGRQGEIFSQTAFFL